MIFWFCKRNSQGEGKKFSKIETFFYQKSGFEVNAGDLAIIPLSLKRLSHKGKPQAV